MVNIYIIAALVIQKFEVRHLTDTKYRQCGICDSHCGTGLRPGYDVSLQGLVSLEV